MRLYRSSDPRNIASSLFSSAQSPGVVHFYPTIVCFALLVLCSIWRIAGQPVVGNSLLDWVTGGRALTTAEAWERAGTHQLGEFTARDHHVPQV